MFIQSHHPQRESHFLKISPFSYKILWVVCIIGLMLWTPLHAQQLNIDFGGGGSVTARLFQIIFLLTILTLAPSILVMTTCFLRILIALSFLRQALGTQQAPPNMVIVSLALFLTFFVMEPTLNAIYDNAIAPLLNEQITEQEAFNAGVQPLKDFMMLHVGERELGLFYNIAGVEANDNTDVPLRILLPAFMISEIKYAFEIGFLLFVPFLLIDIAIASVLMSMGMMLLPPVVVSLPFKIIFFVIVDGWYLISGSLVRSFA